MAYANRTAPEHLLALSSFIPTRWAKFSILICHLQSLNALNANCKNFELSCRPVNALSDFEKLVRRLPQPFKILSTINAIDIHVEYRRQTQSQFFFTDLVCTLVLRIVHLGHVFYSCRYAANKHEPIKTSTGIGNKIKKISRNQSHTVCSRVFHWMLDLPVCQQRSQKRLRSLHYQKSREKVKIAAS